MRTELYPLPHNVYKYVNGLPTVAGVTFIMRAITPMGKSSSIFMIKTFTENSEYRPIDILNLPKPDMEALLTSSLRKIKNIYEITQRYYSRWDINRNFYDAVRFKRYRKGYPVIIHSSYPYPSEKLQEMINVLVGNVDRQLDIF